MPAGAPPRPGRPFAAGRRPRWPWALGGLALLALLLVALRQPLTEGWWPQARIDRLLAEGEAALAAGRLDQADGQGARQKFEAAQALDSDRGEGRAGLLRVGQAALARADREIEASRLDPARRWLALAAELQLPRAHLEPVAASLRRAEAAATDLPALRARAAAALESGDVEAALPLYAQWLALEPGEMAALEGREDALSLLLEPVPRALHAGDLAGAAWRLALARGHDPGHVSLPGLQAAYARALAAQLGIAQRRLQRGHLEQAAAAFARLRDVAPEDPAVAQGAARAATALSGQARLAAADFRFDEAGRLLRLARGLAPDGVELEGVARDLERARAAEARLHPPPASPRTPRTLALQRTLEEFDQALRRGEWIDPPGASAYDRLRVAEALAPADPAVHSAAARMRGAVADCVEAALRDNRLRMAQGCHDAWRTLVPADPVLAGVSQRLAQRWLAVGEERLRAGELEVAVRALDAARALDPATPGLADFAARLDRARGGVPPM